jgi:hypothetical protein
MQALAQAESNVPPATPQQTRSGRISRPPLGINQGMLAALGIFGSGSGSERREPIISGVNGSRKRLGKDGAGSSAFTAMNRTPSTTAIDATITPRTDTNRSHPHQLGDTGGTSPRTTDLSANNSSKGRKRGVSILEADSEGGDQGTKNTYPKLPMWPMPAPVGTLSRVAMPKEEMLARRRARNKIAGEYCSSSFMSITQT